MGPLESGLCCLQSPLRAGMGRGATTGAECSPDAKGKNPQRGLPGGASAWAGSFLLAPAYGGTGKRRSRVEQEEARAAPLPDVVNHRGLKDTEEPVLLGVLGPFLYFTPGGRRWRERGKQVSRLQDDVFIILPGAKGRRVRARKGFYRRPLFLDDSS